MKSLVYSLLVVLFIGACTTKDAETFNKDFVALDQKIAKGELPNFENSKELLDSLKRTCETQRAEIEFKTDDENVRELANLNKVIEKITTRITALGKEKEVFEKVYVAGKDAFQTIEACNNYLHDFPDGLKRIEVEGQYNEILGKFMDDVAGQVNTHFTSLNETNTESSIFQLASYTNEKVGAESVEYSEADYDAAFTNYTDAKSKIQQVLNTVTVEISTAKGNSPRTLGKLFDDYDNKHKEMRTKRETMIRELVLEQMKSGGWESQARVEINSYIVRDRGGYFSSCRAYELSNDIKQAEDYTTTLLSNKIEVYLHYNISSYCGTNIKYKYYDAKFKLVFPIIESKLGSGFFDSKVVSQKS
jgi:polyhydroxyalkanoate synthesis regulator phasin